MFQWLFAEEILSPQDSLKSRTLFVISHKFLLRNNAFIFFKRVTPKNRTQAGLRPQQLKVVGCWKGEA